MKAKTVTQLKLNELFTGIELVNFSSCTTDYNPNYSCRPLNRMPNEWHNKNVDVEDCSRSEIARSHRLGRGY